MTTAKISQLAGGTAALDARIEIESALGVSGQITAQALIDLPGSTTYQPLDSDLTAMAALAPANDSIMQRKAGAWVDRTIAQVGADLLTGQVGGPWGEPIATWVYSSSVSAVDFTGLSAYRELLVIGTGITHGDAGTQNMVLRTSIDNGSTFATSAFTNYGGSTGSGLLMVGTIATAAVCGFRGHLTDFNVAARSTQFSAMGGQATSSTNRASYFGYRDTPELNDALRITNSGGINFTAGNILLFGRKG